MNGWSDFNQIWYASVSYDVVGPYWKWIRWTNIWPFVIDFRVKSVQCLVNTISNERMVRFQPNLVCWCLLWCSQTQLKVDTLDQHLTYFFYRFLGQIGVILNTITSERVVGFQPNFIWRCILCSQTLLNVYMLGLHLIRVGGFQCWCVLWCSRTLLVGHYLHLILPLSRMI